jgi:hypothetical protein
VDEIAAALKRLEAKLDAVLEARGFISRDDARRIAALAPLLHAAFGAEPFLVAEALRLAKRPGEYPALSAALAGMSADVLGKLLSVAARSDAPLDYVIERLQKKEKGAVLWKVVLAPPIGP